MLVPLFAEHAFELASFAEGEYLFFPLEPFLVLFTGGVLFSEVAKESPSSKEDSSKPAKESPSPTKENSPKPKEESASPKVVSVKKDFTREQLRVLKDTDVLVMEKKTLIDNKEKAAKFGMYVTLAG